MISWYVVINVLLPFLANKPVGMLFVYSKEL
jgi:hypothetical protein